MATVNKHMVTITEYELFVDLDGVVADFAHGIRHVHIAVHGYEIEHKETQYELDPAYRRLMWDTVSDYQKNGGEMWYELPLMEDAMDLWDHVKDHNPQILTATGNPGYGAGEQKRRWVAEKFGDHVVVNLARKAREKAVHAGPNRILIDDKLKAIDPWKEAGGIGILHTSAESTIAQLKALGI